MSDYSDDREACCTELPAMTLGIAWRDLIQPAIPRRHRGASTCHFAIR
jgi:hypothetical protein